MGKIYKTSFIYKIVRFYANFVYRRWFGSIEINGRENVPEKEPVIFAPNHQNGFLDAMAVISSVPDSVFFLARADLFNNKIIGNILQALKVMPAYRIRDGIKNLKKNEDSFEQAIEVLLHKKYFCLMPEGGQEEKRTLRPLVKGMFRIAFATQSILEEKDYVRIIPVGIDYGNYDHTGSHLVVNFGRPIDIRDYYDLYKENHPMAQNQLRDDLHQRMEPLMLNIQSTTYYECFYTASYLYNFTLLLEQNREDTQTDRLIVRRQLISILQKAEAANDPALPELDAWCKAWNKKHKDTAFSAEVGEFGDQWDANLTVSLSYLIFTIPFMLYAAVINGIPFLLVRWLTRKTPNTGFEASFVFGLTAVLFPIFYIIEALFFVKTDYPLVMKLAFVVTLPFSLYFMTRYRWMLKFVAERFRNIFGKEKELTKIIDSIGKIANKYNACP